MDWSLGYEQGQLPVAVLGLAASKLQRPERGRAQSNERVMRGVWLVVSRAIVPPKNTLSLYVLKLSCKQYSVAEVFSLPCFQGMRPVPGELVSCHQRGMACLPSAGCQICFVD
eukprot:CAMPEP_0197652862 /NCGR_PEP_ID=MMETSP1338-20131121/34701_1 /TAXON_ID=43686 ORGANISM="Pelagodinium beii, Strain RCC1491" /NCGR_SAMPLE_ID=MMETSP1338 /ASSEMBLY_ACC=CAM_ASM_000754 /LENGTH=112 /DNA_ID=CAMNT_0043227815 /DNA_START=1 /DNA_END=339 /DNA_ORIENTATION=-